MLQTDPINLTHGERLVTCGRVTIMLQCVSRTDRHQPTQGESHATKRGHYSQTHEFFKYACY